MYRPRRAQPRIYLAIAALVFALFPLACNGDPDEPLKPVASVDVTPSTATAEVGGTVELDAQPRDADGNPLNNRTVTWSSDDESVATVDDTGLVTGVAAGTAIITATSEGVSGTATVQITEQGEVAVECLEGAPIALRYSNHSPGCKLEPVADLDQFVFSGTAGEVIRATAGGQGDALDMAVELFGPSGQVGSRVSCFSTRPIGRCAAILEATLPETGTYNVIVSEAGTDNTGPYTFQLERLHPPINTLSLAFGQVLPDVLDVITDMDAFLFTADNGSLIRVVVAGQTDLLDMRAELLGPGGELVASGSCTTTRPIGTCATTLEPGSLATSGDYQIHVRENGTDQVGNYSVSLTCLGGACL